MIHLAVSLICLFIGGKERGLACGPRFPGANYVAQAAVKVMEILLLQPSECWSYSGHHHAQLSLFSMHGSPCFWFSEIVSFMPM